MMSIEIVISKQQDVGVEWNRIEYRKFSVMWDTF